jgi:hypothetical protein
MRYTCIYMHKWLTTGLMLFAVLPATTNYKLNSYGFSSGGGTGSTSNYSLEGSAGTASGPTTASTNYKIGPAYIGTQQANVPTIATLDNNSGNYYNKLHFVVGTQNNPADAKYAIQISTDNFAGDIRYVKSDLTVGTTLAAADFQTYAGWGSASGANVIGLSPGTNYYMRASASQGTYTQTQWGPVNGPVATASPSLTFNLTTSAQANPPFSVSFGTLTSGNVGTTGTTINLGLSTNATNGANLYIRSKNAGLKSASTSSTLASATADLGAVGTGYGAQSSSVSQTSGGPLTALSPYNSGSSSVGLLDTSNRGLYTSAGPIAGGAASLVLKAKSTATSVAANDYTDVLTLVAAGNF